MYCNDNKIFFFGGGGGSFYPLNTLDRTLLENLLESLKSTGKLILRNMYMYSGICSICSIIYKVASVCVFFCDEVRDGKLYPEGHRMPTLTRKFWNLPLKVTLSRGCVYVLG